ncbi:hypothetical protein FBU59_002566 [Linderina macrospora]|uniref:Uncharacterized protein n=1 Tax=Linderina macrospora TaxID=4868 RepID=A0ACC1JAY2_9FUNG|nr:hypothetical protein FBU59_002566 [Linderina macrospora]
MLASERRSVDMLHGRNKPLKPANSILGIVRRRNTTAATPAVRRPIVITRIDAPKPQTLEPTLDLDEIIRRKDDILDAIDQGVDPSSPSDTSSITMLRSGKRPISWATSEPVVQRSLDMPRASTDNRSSLGDGRRRLRHDYFRVATMDGHPTIPAQYQCPIALCGSRFLYFEQLQEHWTEHPWNRGGILTPVCDGGTRRLGWWEHKKKFLASVVHGKHRVESQEEGDRSRLRRRAISMDQVCRSDYGDISLFGSRSYHVSPKVVPMRQVAVWESERDRR